MRRKLCQMAYRARRALLGPPDRPACAMPVISQPSRYLLPKARPPSRLWERRQAATKLTPSQSDSALLRKISREPLPPLHESSPPARPEPAHGGRLLNARTGRARLQTSASPVAFSNFDWPSSTWMVAPPSMDEMLRQADEMVGAGLLDDNLPRPLSRAHLLSRHQRQERTLPSPMAPAASPATSPTKTSSPVTPPLRVPRPPKLAHRNVKASASFITDLATLSSKGTMGMAAMLCNQATSGANFEPRHQAVNTWLDDCIEARTRTERKTFERLNEVPTV